MSSITIALPSLKSLLVAARANGGRQLATATGFAAVHDGRHYLVTNWHVAAGRNPKDGKFLSKSGAVPDELFIMHNGAQIGRWDSRVERLHDANGAPLWLEHPVYGRRVDVVALPLTQTEGITVYPYDPASPGLPIAFGPSQTVSIIGFPFGTTGSGEAGGVPGIWVQGAVATEPALEFDGLPCFLVDSRTRPGQSGSPVIVYRTGVYSTDDGSVMASTGPVERFIGVYSGRINKDSDLGFVWKASALVEILAAQRPGPMPTIGAPSP